MSTDTPPEEATVARPEPKPESVKVELTRKSRGLAVGDVLEVDVERAKELVDSFHARYCE